MVRTRIYKRGNQSAVIVEHYGDVLYQLGKVAEAVEQWKKAKELGSESPFIDQKINKQNSMNKLWIIVLTLFLFACGKQ